MIFYLEIISKGYIAVTKIKSTSVNKMLIIILKNKINWAQLSFSHILVLKILYPHEYYIGNNIEPEL